MNSYLGQLGSALQIFAAGILIQAVAAVIYRWKFHPLARHPGPFLGKITDLYMLYYSWTGRAHLLQLALHEQYGPVVRVHPNRLIFQSPVALKDIYTSHKVKKASSYEATCVVPGHQNSFTITNKEAHRVKRKALSPALSESSVRKFATVIEENVDIFINQLINGADDGTLENASKTVDGWSPSRNMADRIKYLTFDVIALFGFGTSFKLQTEEMNRSGALAIRPVIQATGLYIESPWLKPFQLERYYKADAGRPGGKNSEFGPFVRRMMETRLEKGQSGDMPDMFSHFAEMKGAEEGDSFCLDDLWTESRLFLTAGSDTSATVLSSAFFYLARYQDAYEKLATEVRSKFQLSDEIHFGPALSSCVYVRAVIDEALRMSTPVGKALWRKVGEGGVNIDGEFVPAGVEVGVAIYAIFRMEEIYPEASTFIPDRWLESSKRFAPHLPAARAAFKPFSLGSRNCVGMNLAIAEMTVTLAKTVFNLDFRVPKGAEARIGEGSPTGPPGRRFVNEFQIEHYVLPLYDGPYIQWKRRNV